MSEGIQLPQISDRSSPHLHHHNTSQNKTCTLIMGGVLTTMFLTIFSVFMDSLQQHKRINYVQGPMAKHAPFYSGQLHYSRIPWQYWEHRILMVKAMGFDAISAYIMWNFHQVKKGQFDFQSPQKNLTRFLELTAKHEMKVLLRPGPYVCAEWDFGGLPIRLLAEQKMKLRTHCSRYQAQVKIYFQALVPVIRPFLQENGGNIILLQLQNELGSLNSDINHTLALKQMWKDLKVQSQFYIEDAPWFWQKHYWPGAHVGLSEGPTVKSFTDIDITNKRKNTSLIFGGEIYTGWLTHWGQKMKGRGVKRFTQHFDNLVRAKRSVSLYVAHGGTNFGLTAGANGFPNNDYMPAITSYDYGSPINEQGAPTTKYHAIRNIISKYLKKDLPSIPQGIKTIQIAPFAPTKVQSYLFANLPRTPVVNQGNLTYFESDIMKMYNQGFALYETQLHQKRSYYFNITFRDYLMVYLDNVYQLSIPRLRQANYIFTVSCLSPPCTLRLLVQAMGHVNYGFKQMTDRKGIIDFYEYTTNPAVPTNTEFKWNIYSIPVNDDMTKWSAKETQNKYPALVSGTFEVTSPGDTYLDMTKYKKGYLWVNGNLLGRYWHIGPQTKLFCPGVWLKRGSNEIVILDLYSDKLEEIQGYTKGDAQVE